MAKYFREDRMVRVYRHRDKKAKQTVCDFDNEWLHDNITCQPCFYCGSTHNIGSDRIDNCKGHTKDNIVPCCKQCNLIRNRFFSHNDYKKIVLFCKENNISPYGKETTNLWCT